MNAGGKCDTGAFELGVQPRRLLLPQLRPLPQRRLQPRPALIRNSDPHAHRDRHGNCDCDRYFNCDHYGNCDAKLNRDGDSHRDQHADFVRYGRSDSHSHCDGDSNRDSDGHLNRDEHRDSNRHSDRDQDCHPDRDGNWNVDANRDRYANQDDNCHRDRYLHGHGDSDCHRDAGRRTHLGDAEKAKPAGVPARDSVRSNHDPKHRHWPANRRRRCSGAAVHGDQRRKRDRNRCGRKPSTDNRLLAHCEGIVERSDRDNERRRQSEEGDQGEAQGQVEIDGRSLSADAFPVASLAA